MVTLWREWLRPIGLILVFPFVVLIVATRMWMAWLVRPSRMDTVWHSMAPRQEDLAGHGRGIDRVIGSVQERYLKGGPLIGTFLLSDGLLLQDIDPAILTLSEGRLRVALYHGSASDSGPDEEYLVVYDRDASCLYTLAQPQGMSADNAFERLRAGPHQAEARVRSALQSAKATVKLHRVLGLLVNEAIPVPLAHLTRRLDNGSLLEGHLLLPTDLRGAADPGRMLQLAPYRLTLDGRDTGLHVPGLLQLYTSPGNACVMLAGLICAGDRASARTWHIWRAGQWHSIMENAVAEGNHTYSLVPLAIADDGLALFRLQPAAGDDRPVPRKVRLHVSWKRVKPTLRHVDQVVSLQVPAKGSGAA